MKSEKDNEIKCEDGSCAGSNSARIWFAGVAVILLSIVFCFALFKTKSEPIPQQSPAQGQTMLPQATQVALPGPNCFTCPSMPQCFPQGTNPPAGQPVAFCPTAPYYPQGYGQGMNQPAGQQAAFCPTTPTYAQCVPQTNTAPAQQAAFGNGFCLVQCPFCAFSFNDTSAARRGSAQCPRCFGFIPFGQMMNPMTNVALPPPNCMTCPSVTQCFPNGQTVALTQPATTPPPIFRDAVMLHEFRGVCENCHIVRPDIPIQSNAQMPHKYRGVCSNCHVILGLKAGA
jgi:hypothetical protein